MKAALITGITGQAGSYLAELLLEQKGYDLVVGIRRRSSTKGTERIAHLLHNPRLVLLYGDVTDPGSIQAAMNYIEAAGAQWLEVYNLAAQSHVQVSFETPLNTAEVDALGVLNVLEAIRRCRVPTVRMCQASTSEMFGAQPPPQNEATPFWPRSPYGVAKVFGYWLTRNYREAYGMYACNSISFNHESERREETFVTRKISQGVARLVEGGPEEPPIELGNLDAQRDWSHAEDVVRAMWLILQQPRPDDYVVSSNHHTSVRAFVEAAFGEAGVTVAWRGQGVDERAVDAATGRVLVRINPAFFRPAEVNSLCGDSSKLRAATGWAPRVSFQDLVRRMVQHDRQAFAAVAKKK